MFQLFVPPVQIITKNKIQVGCQLWFSVFPRVCDMSGDSHTINEASNQIQKKDYFLRHTREPATLSKFNLAMSQVVGALFEKIMNKRSSTGYGYLSG